MRRDLFQAVDPVTIEVILRGSINDTSQIDLIKEKTKMDREFILSTSISVVMMVLGLLVICFPLLNQFQKFKCFV